MGDGAITSLLLADEKLTVTGVDNEPKMLEQSAQALGGATVRRQARHRS
jgi:ubiquinone/menaquinone biosynthesis C-methylase UbiE